MYTDLLKSISVALWFIVSTWPLNGVWPLLSCDREDFDKTSMQIPEVTSMLKWKCQLQNDTHVFDVYIRSTETFEVLSSAFQSSKNQGRWKKPLSWAAGQTSIQMCLIKLVFRCTRRFAVPRLCPSTHTTSQTQYTLMGKKASANQWIWLCWWQPSWNQLD